MPCFPYFLKAYEEGCIDSVVPIFCAAMKLLSPSCLRTQCGVMRFSILLILSFLTGKGAFSSSSYLIGLGSYDITGPAADVNMMGTSRKSCSFVNLDACMASQLVTIKVLERLKARYGNLYTENNVAISGIHTHAGPGVICREILDAGVSRTLVLI
ncbi:Neutral ceramidase 1 [Bienertia sinuspersici]